MAKTRKTYTAEFKLQAVRMVSDHAVRWVYEADRANWLPAPEAATVIERIEFGSGGRTTSIHANG